MVKAEIMPINVVLEVTKIDSVSSLLTSLFCLLTLFYVSFCKEVLKCVV